MVGDEPKKLFTLDHANKRGEAAARRRYAFWLKKAQELRQLRDRTEAGEFRRDRVVPRDVD